MSSKLDIDFRDPQWLMKYRETLRKNKRPRSEIDRTMDTDVETLRLKLQELEKNERACLEKLNTIGDLKYEISNLESQKQECKSQLERLNTRFENEFNVSKKLTGENAQLMEENAKLMRENAKLLEDLHMSSPRIPKPIPEVRGYVCTNPYNKRDTSNPKQRAKACVATMGTEESFDNVRKIPGGKYKMLQPCVAECHFD